MIWKKSFEKALYPLLRGGVAAPYKKISRYLDQGAAGGGQTDLPGRAEAKVA